MTAKPLTAQQENVLSFVERFLREHGFPPTLREIGQAIGLGNVNAVRGHLAALEKKGYITRTPDRARSIQVVHAPSVFSRVKRKLHDVLGTDEGVLHQVIYGLAWTTWRRAPILTELRRDSVSRAVDREAAEHGWNILSKRIEAAHVVVVVQAWPNHSPEQTVRRLRSAARVALHRDADAFPGETLWDKGYAVTTDLELLDDLVVRLLGHRVAENTEGKGTP